MSKSRVFRSGIAGRHQSLHPRPLQPSFRVDQSYSSAVDLGLQSDRAAREVKMKLGKGGQAEPKVNPPKHLIGQEVTVIKARSRGIEADPQFVDLPIIGIN